MQYALMTVGSRCNMKEFIEKLYDKFEEKYRESESCNKFERVFRQAAFKEAIAIVSELAREYINTSTDISTDTSTTNAEWKQHILNRFEGDRR